MEGLTTSATSRQRTIQLTLLGIILATLPCYCVGFLLLAVRPTPSRGAAPTNTPTPFLLATETANPFATPSITPISPLVSPTSPIFIQPTPTQFFFVFSPTPPPFPTATPFVFPTPTFVIIPPTATPIEPPTSTPVPSTATPLPPTETPIPFPTLETPTETPLPFPTLSFNTPTPDSL